MGASVSKHGHTNCLKTDKRSSKTKVEPFNPAIAAKVNQESKRRYKFYKRNKMNKKAGVNKLTIGNPTDFIHLNHAGMDGISNLDTLFIPIEEAQQREKYKKPNATTRTAFMNMNQYDNLPAMNTNYTLPTSNNIQFNDIMHFNKLHLALITSMNGCNGIESDEAENTVDIKFYGAGSPLKRKPINYSMFADNEDSTIIEERAPSTVIAPMTATH